MDGSSPLAGYAGRLFLPHAVHPRRAEKLAVIAEDARLLSDLEAAKAEETYSPAELRHGTHGPIKLHAHEADELEAAGTDLANAMLSVEAALSKAYGCGDTLTKEIATQRLETVLDVEVSEGELSKARCRIVGAAARLQLARGG